MANTNTHPQQAGMMGGLQSEVSVEAAPLLQFITRHVAVIVGVIVLLIIAIVATGVYQWQSEKAEREAHLALGKVLTSTTGEAKVTALDALLKDAPASLREGMQLELALAALEAEQYDKAAEAFGAVAKADSTAMGTAAGLNQAAVLLRGNKADEALAVLEGLERTAPEPMLPQVLTSVAMAAEAAGKPERAIKAYESLIALGDSEATSYFEARIRALRAPAAPAQQAAPQAAPSAEETPAAETPAEQPAE